MSKISKAIFFLSIIMIFLLSQGCSLFKKSQEGVSTGKKVSIPAEIEKNKFGFLGGEPGQSEFIKENGALWMRPHPGPFLWDSMQSEKNEEIIFDKTDRVVSEAQETKLGILATIWPFAEWDQKSKPDADKYKVSENDEFMPGTKEGRMDYLPIHRSNPGDWQAYEKWVKETVERYDGDGKIDMPGLEIPIKYWEVMNEPDLNSPEPDPRLDFYTQGPKEYSELLIRTAKAIRQADPEAKILIAGAAGGNDDFLGFYKEVFKNKEAVDSFDIGNVHCISNDSFDSFNVEPYLKMLNETIVDEYGITKPVWVTEAEAFISEDADLNAGQTFQSTKKAINLGAERIFFTRYDFENKGPMPPKLPGGKTPSTDIRLDGSDPVKAYRKITEENK